MSRTIKVLCFLGHSRNMLLIRKRKVLVDIVLLGWLERKVVRKLIKYLCGWLASGHITRETTHHKIVGVFLSWA